MAFRSADKRVGKKDLEDSVVSKKGRLVRVEDSLSDTADQERVAPKEQPMQTATTPRP